MVIKKQLIKYFKKLVGIKFDPLAAFLEKPFFITHLGSIKSQLKKKPTTGP